MSTITVRSQVFGGLADSPEIFPVLLNLIPQRLSLAELIQRSVEAQVHNLVVQHQINAQQVRSALLNKFTLRIRIIYSTKANSQHGKQKLPVNALYSHLNKLFVNCIC